MARLRQTPTCPFCGEETHKAIYREQEPYELPFFGDTFLRWESLNHKCKKKKVLNSQKDNDSI